MSRQDDIDFEDFDMEDIDMDMTDEAYMELDFSDAARVRRMVEMYRALAGWGAE